MRSQKKSSNNKPKKFGASKTQSTDIVRSYFGKPLKNGISSLNGNLVGFPDRLRVKLKWDEEYNYISSAFTGNVFRGNSIYDPDYTGVFSTAPAYYTSLKAVYGQYCVLGSRIKAQVVNEASVGAEVVLWCSDVNIGADTFQNMAESKRCKVLELGSLTGQGRGKIEMACSSEEIQGQKHLESDSNNYSSMSANPGDTWYFGVFGRSLDASNVNLYIRVTMEFDVVLKELVSYTSLKSEEHKIKTFCSDSSIEVLPVAPVAKVGSTTSSISQELTREEILDRVAKLLINKADPGPLS